MRLDGRGSIFRRTFARFPFTGCVRFILENPPGRLGFVACAAVDAKPTSEFVYRPSCNSTALVASFDGDDADEADASGLSARVRSAQRGAFDQNVAEAAAAATWNSGDKNPGLRAGVDAAACAGYPGCSFPCSRFRLLRRRKPCPPNANRRLGPFALQRKPIGNSPFPGDPSPYSLTSRSPTMLSVRSLSRFPRAQVFGEAGTIEADFRRFGLRLSDLFVGLVIAGDRDLLPSHSIRFIG